MWRKIVSDVHKIKARYGLDTSTVCEGESKGDTNILCGALNEFHMSRAHTASADSLIKLRGDEGREKRGSGCTDV